MIFCSNRDESISNVTEAITEWNDNIFNESLKHLPCSVADDNISCEVDVLSASETLKVSNFSVIPDQRVLFVSCPDSKYFKIIVDYIDHAFSQVFIFLPRIVTKFLFIFFI